MNIGIVKDGKPFKNESLVDGQVYSCAIVGERVPDPREPPRDPEWREYTSSQYPLFCGAIGQEIPRPDPIEYPNRWYTDALTNMTQVGQLGSAFGDAGIYFLATHIERAAKLPSGAWADHGATPEDLEVLREACAFELNLIHRPMYRGPLWASDSSLTPHERRKYIGKSYTPDAGLQFEVPEEELAHGGRALKVTLILGWNDSLQGILYLRNDVRLRPTSTGKPRGVLVSACLRAIFSKDLVG